MLCDAVASIHDGLCGSVGWAIHRGVDWWCCPCVLHDECGRTCGFLQVCSLNREPIWKIWIPTAPFAGLSSTDEDQADRSVRTSLGFALTVVYIVVTIISPEQFGPEWANYHAFMYLAGITFLFSLPAIFARTQLGFSIQIYLMLALIVAIALSAVANGWIGGAFASWQVFLPSAAVFFFIVLNVTTIRRLKILTLAAVVSCLVVVVEALCGYYGGFRGNVFVLQQTLYMNDEVVGQVARLRGAGFLNDPNDFAQILIIALPLVFIAWKKRRGFAYSLIVFIPAVMLLWAIYLTHSRGAFIALALLALMAAKKRLGNTASVVLTACLVLVMVGLDFTGNRGISLSGRG